MGTRSPSSLPGRMSPQRRACEHWEALAPLRVGKHHLKPALAPLRCSWCDSQVGLPVGTCSSELFSSILGLLLQDASFQVDGGQLGPLPQPSYFLGEGLQACTCEYSVFVKLCNSLAGG